MSDTYTKLFSSITESTVWGEPYSTRIVWVTMLAMADARGDVYGAIPGLARRANVTLPEVETALAAFLAPDCYSRTKDEDGRRIEEIPGGWKLINHAKYGAVRNAEERAAYKRDWDRQNRPSGHARAQSDSPTQSDDSPTNPTGPTPSAPTPTSERSRERATVRQVAQPDGFDAFYAAYPVKKGRAAARKAWRKVKPEQVPEILAALQRQVANDDDWQRGFAPHPATYINGERWNDAIAQPKQQTNGHAPMGKTATAIAILEASKRERHEHRLAVGRDRDGDSETPVLIARSHPGG